MFIFRKSGNGRKSVRMKDEAGHRHTINQRVPLRGPEAAIRWSTHAIRSPNLWRHYREPLPQALFFALVCVAWLPGNVRQVPSGGFCTAFHRIWIKKIEYVDNSFFTWTTDCQKDICLLKLVILVLFWF